VNKLGKQGHLQLLNGIAVIVTDKGKFHKISSSLRGGEADAAISLFDGDCHTGVRTGSQ